MSISHRPMQFTIFFGLICGLAFIPSIIVLSHITFWSLSFRIIVWLYLLIYSFLLTRWGKAPLNSIVFPVLVLFIFVFIPGSSNITFLIFSLGMLSWVRSGICFQGSLFKMLIAEFLICMGGAALVTALGPQTNLSWAMGIWVFFLIQALYFIFRGGKRLGKTDNLVTDSFEQSSRAMDKILRENF